MNDHKVAKALGLIVAILYMAGCCALLMGGWLLMIVGRNFKFGLPLFLLGVVLLEWSYLWSKDYKEGAEHEESE